MHVIREMAFVIARPVYYHIRKINRMTMLDGSERARKCYAYNINNVTRKRYVDRANIFLFRIEFLSINGSVTNYSLSNWPSFNHIFF